MEDSYLPLDIITELFPRCKLRIAYLLGSTCVDAHKKLSVHLSTRLECLIIDFELINKFTGCAFEDIYLSHEKILELQKACQKLNYDSLCCCYIDIVFQQIENLCLANDELEIRDEIRDSSGIYSYYGIDGSFSSLAYLYTATRFSSLITFTKMLEEFRDCSSDNAYSDNIYVERCEFPDDIFHRLAGKTSVKSSTFIARNNMLPISIQDGDLVDCDLLRSISKNNKHSEISQFLVQLKGYTLWSFWWSPDGDEYENVTRLLGDEVGVLVAIPKGSWTRPDYYDILRRLIAGHAIISLGKVNIYTLRKES